MSIQQETTILPNFFIIGAPKCGTTSLAAWLSEHPKIFLSPIKEPFFFSSDIRNGKIHDWNIYKNLFIDANSNHLSIGEASTTYLFSKVAIPNIENRLPGSRYIVMLRNPVDMAYSLHEQQLRSFNENRDDFYTAWQLASERRAGRQVPPGCSTPILLDYPSWCRLGEQLKRLFTIVPKERVLVLILDDIKENPRKEYLRVLQYLEVADDGRDEFPVFNPARTYRSRRIGKAIHILAKNVAWYKHIVGIIPKSSLGLVQFLEKFNSQQRSRPPLDSKVRDELTTYYSADVTLLESLLERDFSTWRQRALVKS